MKDDSGHFGDHTQDDLKTDLDSMKIWSPWSSGQTFQLNVFQARGNFHAFTCPNHMGFGVVKLVATMDGWVCSQHPECSYTQDWAWLSMLDPLNWKTTAEMASWPPDDGCVCRIEGVRGNWRLVQWSPLCTLHPQLKGTVLDPEVTNDYQRAVASNDCGCEWESVEVGARMVKRDPNCKIHKYLGTQQVLASRPLHMAKGTDLTVMRTVGDPDYDQDKITGYTDRDGFHPVPAEGYDPHADEVEGDDIEIHPEAKPTWTGLFGMDPDYAEDDIEIHFTKADIQSLEAEDLLRIFTKERLLELMPNFSASQQIQLQAYWKGQVTPSQVGDIETSEMFDAAASLGEEVDVEVDLKREEGE